MLARCMVICLSIPISLRTVSLCAYFLNMCFFISSVAAPLLDNPAIVSRVSSPGATHTTRQTSTTLSTFAMATKNPGKHTVHGLTADPIVQSNLNRTYLRPLAERPHRQKTLVRRQNVFEGECLKKIVGFDLCRPFPLLCEALV